VLTLPFSDVSNPGSYEDLVDLLIPEMQRRGLMWNDYAVPGGTYRENLLGTPGHPGVPEGHPAHAFSYDKLKEKYADEDGDITIDRRIVKEEPLKNESLPVLEKTVVNGAATKVNGLQPAVVETRA
jgi:hypothetical protein